jgi:cold shock CspA family protein
MSTIAALPATRAEIFRQGLKNATGTITYWRGRRGTWGTITLDGKNPVEYFVGIEKFPVGDQKDVTDGCRVSFDAEPGQADMRSIELPAGTKRTKPKVSSARLLNFTL